MSGPQEQQGTDRHAPGCPARGTTAGWTTACSAVDCAPPEVSGLYVEQTAEPATAELEESLSRMINTLQARLSWATAGACVRDIAPEVAALVAAAKERGRVEGAAKERERLLKELGEHEAELQRVRTPGDELDGGRIAGVQEAAYIIRAREWSSS